MKLSALIIKARFIIFAMFAAAAVYCVLSIGKVKINPDLRTFLPANSETRRGLAVMKDEFATYASTTVMIKDVTYSKAELISADFAAVPHVSDVSFDESEAHFTDNCALFNISFDGPEDNKDVHDAIMAVTETAKQYDCYISGDTGVNYNSLLAEEMVGVIAISAVVIVLVLLFTSRAFFEVIIFFVVFAFAALLNMGTNFWLGEVSAITNSVAIILQLALAIDYAIIFSHRYQDEAAKNENTKAALTSALAHSIKEISSSSLTTISGLLALTLMQFRLGYDLGVVLAKGIICSMLTVFLLMPGLILLFSKPLKRTSHRMLVPNITGWGNFLAGKKFLFIVIFVLILPFAFFFSEKSEFAFNDSTVTEIIPSEYRTAIKEIKEKFGSTTALAVLLPSGDYEKERRVISEVSDFSEIKSGNGLAGLMLNDDTYLTDDVNAAKIAGLLNIPMDQAKLLFKGYSLTHGGLSGLFGGDEVNEAPLVDLLLFLLEKIDDGTVSLNAEQTEMMETFRAPLERGVKQLHGQKYDRLVFTTSLPAEGSESVSLLEKIRESAMKYYEKDDIIIVGDITSARDLHDSYEVDSLKISLLTIGFVFIILLISFRNIAAALIMIFVIQGSIWINFSFPYLTGSRPSFVTHMIVCAIQMGATIDYAIVFMSRYIALRSGNDKKSAAALAVNESFPTLLTSGTIMATAGFIISRRVSDVYVGHIGLAVGRGALISMLLVLSVLPQLAMFFDRHIIKTSDNLEEQRL